jgi:ParB-like chromosome segregation protein Spo0J
MVRKKKDPASVVVAAVRACAAMPAEERVAAYNAAQSALGDLVRDVSPDPALSPRMFEVDHVRANDYNPNKVASPELDLLETSMRADGITMAIVAVPDGAGGCVVVDGFHRRLVGSERLGRRYLPVAVIDRPLADRMASTVRHNRARGKHQVEMMAQLVRALLDLGKDDAEMAAALGMSAEELLRLRQMVGAARLLAAERYSREFAPVDEAEA